MMKKPAKFSLRVILLEDLVRSKPQRVDREAGVIYGVKVVGLDSENDRQYTRIALTNAKHLYEDMVVNIDHPSKPSESRSAQDRLGKLENVRLADDGLYADLRILKTHPMAERLLEAAETMPDLFGMSHNAQGSGRTEGGVFIVEEISEVRSVDLVADPATTKSLFESRNKTMKNLRSFLESMKFSKPKARAALKALLEDDDMTAPLDMDVGAPADEPDDMDNGMDALKDAVGAVLKAGNHDLAAKIIRMIKAEEAPAPSEPAMEDDEDEEGEEKDMEEEGDDDDEYKKRMMKEQDEDKDKDKNTKESKKSRKPSAGTRALTEARATDLCELAGVKADARLLESMKSMNDTGAISFLKWLKENTDGQQKPSGPRSSAPGSTRSNIPAPRNKDKSGYTSFIESIRN